MINFEKKDNLKSSKTWAFQAYISGIVQGVGYRYFAYRQANALGLTGYVRNLPDGRVEVFAEGEKDKLEKFLGYLRMGPSFSHVEDIQIEWFEQFPKYSRFDISY